MPADATTIVNPVKANQSAGNVEEVGADGVGFVDDGVESFQGEIAPLGDQPGIARAGGVPQGLAAPLGFAIGGGGVRGDSGHVRLGAAGLVRREDHFAAGKRGGRTGAGDDPGGNVTLTRMLPSSN